MPETVSKSDFICNIRDNINFFNSRKSFRLSNLDIDEDDNLILRFGIYMKISNLEYKIIRDITSSCGDKVLKDENEYFDGFSVFKNYHLISKTKIEKLYKNIPDIKFDKLKLKELISKL